MMEPKNAPRWKPVVFHLPYDSPLDDRTAEVAMNNVGRIYGCKRWNRL